MASLNMGISYALTNEEIERLVCENRIGNYAYGYLNAQATFIVRYVGRSDNDLRECIKHGFADVEAEPSCRYERFKFNNAECAQEAYEKGCCNYHDFGGDRGNLKNTIHPAKPEGYNCKCPVCDN